MEIKVTSYYFSETRKNDLIDSGTYKKMLVPNHKFEYTEMVTGFFEPLTKDYKDLKIVFIEIENTDNDIYYVKKNYIYTGYVVDFDIIAHLKSLAEKESRPNSFDDIFKDFDEDMKELNMKFDDISDMFDENKGIFGTFDNMFGYSPKKKKKAVKEKTKEELKKDLESALAVEAYEAAVKLRDQIKELENEDNQK